MAVGEKEDNVDLVFKKSRSRIGGIRKHEIKHFLVEETVALLLF